MSLSLVPPDAGPVLIKSHEPGSPEWLAQRRDKIGGSEIADVLGLGFSSRYRLYWEKAIMLPRWSDAQTDELFYWGKAQEPIILQRYADDRAIEAPDHTVVPWPGTYVRDGWMLASPDGMERARLHPDLDGVIEIKSVSSQAMGWSSTEYPPKYRAQVLWNCHVMGVRRGRLVVKIDSAGYRVYPWLDLDTDPDARDDLSFMIERGQQFLLDLDQRNDPLPDDGSDATWEAARRIHPDIDKGAVAEIGEPLPGEYLLALEELDRATKELTRLKSKIIAEMGTAQNAHAVGDDSRFAYRTYRSKADGTQGVPFLSPDKRMREAMKTIKELRDAEA